MRSTTVICLPPTKSEDFSMTSWRDWNRYPQSSLLRPPSSPVSSISTSHLTLAPSAQEWKERRKSISQDNSIPDIDKIAAAIDSGEPLDESQIRVFERMIKWEIDGLSDELKGKATSQDRAYPQ